MTEAVEACTFGEAARSFADRLRRHETDSSARHPGVHLESGPALILRTLDKLAAELLTRIQQQVFKGEMRKPVIFRSPADCLGLVRTSPGAICAALAGATLPPEAKVVEIR